MAGTLSTALARVRQLEEAPAFKTSNSSHTDGTTSLQQDILIRIEASLQSLRTELTASSTTSTTVAAPLPTGAPPKGRMSLYEKILRKDQRVLYRKVGCTRLTPSVRKV